MPGGLEADGCGDPNVQIDGTLPTAFTTHASAGRWEVYEEAQDYVQDDHQAGLVHAAPGRETASSPSTPGRCALDEVDTAAALYLNPAESRSVRGYLTRFRPGGLDIENRAAPHSRTMVTVRPEYPRSGDGDIETPPDSIKRVRVWMSTDSGRSWRLVPLHRSDATWAADVHNPGSGFVALRATVEDTHGDSSTTTVFRAYAVR